MTRLLAGFLSALILAAALLGAACSSSDSTTSTTATKSGAQSATEAPTEGATQAPTDSPSPTDTPTEAPTATPSNAANAVAGAQAEFAHVRVTLNAIQDPWTSDNQFIQPAAGKRYVAFDATIEFFNDSGTHSANPFNFGLSDAQSFAYNPTFGGPEPALNAVELHPGEKTRGWVLFEVTNGPLQKLRYQPNPLKDTYIEFNFGIP